MKHRYGALLTAVGTLAVAWPVLADHHESAKGTATAHPPRIAVVDLQAAAGNPVNGKVTFIQQGDKVTVIADVRGLEPNSSHGFHIHEKGDCSAGDFTSAGGHFNPAGHPHGRPSDAQRHAGDLGNLEATGSGRAYKRLTVDGITLEEGANSIVGRGVIVHAKMDDYGQPTGNAGGRIACGVVRLVRGHGGQ